VNLEYYFSKDYLFTVGGPHQFLKYWLVIFALIFIIGNVIYFIYRRKNNYPAVKNLIKQIWYLYMAWGILGLTAVFARSESLPTLGSRLLVYIIFLFFIITNIWLAYYYIFKTKKAIEVFKHQKRKEQWLKKK